MASKRWHINIRDIWSAVRHTAVPLVAGAGVAALESARTGAVTPKAIGAAALTAAVSGAIRLLQRWASEIK